MAQFFLSVHWAKKLSHFDLNSWVAWVETKTFTMYFIGRVTQFFANNYLTEYRITMEFLHKFLKTLP